MKKSAPIYIAGHRGLAGSAFVRFLIKQGYGNIITVDHDKLDLKKLEQTKRLFKKYRPKYVILAAAKVGGIQANRTFPADFLYDNLAIQNNIFHCALNYGVEKLLFLGSSCIYPKECPQPMKEEYLLTGPLEPTNEGYALAKIAGLKLAEYLYRQHGFKSVCVMPCNIYGPNDSFDPQRAHVLSSLVKKFIDAINDDEKKVTLWGTGIARREFIHVDDMVRLAIEVMNRKETPDIVNIGSGVDMSIKELAELIAEKTGYKGILAWDSSMPDGMLKKCLDVSKIKTLGLKPEISLEKGIDGIIREYKNLVKNKS
jgi:GDP-L-fucose synthase